MENKKEDGFEIVFDNPENIKLDNGRILTYKKWVKTGSHTCKGYDKDGRNYALYTAIAGRLEGEIIHPAIDEKEQPERIQPTYKETLKVNKYEYGEKTVIFKTRDADVIRTLREQCEVNKQKTAMEALLKEEGEYKLEQMSHDKAKTTAVAKALNPLGE